MDLFNFFTEITTDENRFKSFEIAYKKLKPICQNVQFVSVTREDNSLHCSIIGQIIADHGTFGIKELKNNLEGIHYYFFNADYPDENNFPKKQL